MFIKIDIYYLFSLFFSNIEAAPNSNTISKDDKEGLY